MTATVLEKSGVHGYTQGEGATDGELAYTDDNNHEPINEKPKSKKSTEALPTKKFTVLIRPAFKTLCQDDACQAAMFNHILYNIARLKQKNLSYWHATGDAIWNETQQSWGKSKTLKEIKALVTTGLVSQTSNPNNQWDRTKYYTFGEKEAKVLHDLCVKNEIALSAMKFPPAVSHLLKITNAFCKSNECICCKHQIDLVDSTTRFVENEIETGSEEAPEADVEDPTRTLSKDSQEGLSQEGGENLVSSARESEQPDPPLFFAEPEQEEAPTFPGNSTEPEKNAPAAELPKRDYGIPANLFGDFGTKDFRTMSKAEQERLDQAEARARNTAIRKRRAEILVLIRRLFGSDVDIPAYVKLDGVAANDKATDAMIEAAFQVVEKKAEEKRDPLFLNIGKVFDALPGCIRSQMKVVENTAPREKTWEEKTWEEKEAEIAEAERLEEERQQRAKERRARENQERMALA